MTENNPAVVIDNGSGYIKAGISGDEKPKTVFPTIVGTSKLSGKVSFGNNCFTGMMTLKHPIDKEYVNNWYDLEEIWKFAFNEELKLKSENQPVLLTEYSLTEKAQRECKTQIMFETFKVPSFYLSSQATLSIMASGRSTGIVVECGHGLIQTVPVFEGCELSYAVLTNKFGGSDITEYFLSILKQKGTTIEGNINKEEIRKIKETDFYIAKDYNEENEKHPIFDNIEKSYELPDGQQITISNERFKCPEALFNPSLLGINENGIHENTFSSIMKCDIDIRNDLYENIILSGGTSMFKGMKERMEKEMIDLAPPTMKINVVDRPERNIAAWIGGSVLSSLSSFENMVVTKKEYDESGPAIVHRRCF